MTEMLPCFSVATDLDLKKIPPSKATPKSSSKHLLKGGSNWKVELWSLGVKESSKLVMSTAGSS